ncbi:MAG: molybdopterin-dependent oxidoreductase [Pirellulaceae bacterium]
MLASSRVSEPAPPPWSLRDVEHADCVFVIGGNPASNHPRLISVLRQVRKRGGEVVVINPIVELGLVNFRIPSNPMSLLFGSKIASKYVQPHIGGDLALLTGIAKRVLERGEADLEFLRQHCRNSDEWIEHLREASWDDIVAGSGIDRETIDTLAALYGKSRNAVFSWTMGITHHSNGVQNVQAIANLALMRGMVGRPKAGLLPIRGHSNVQGIGSVGVTPKLADTIFQRLRQHYNLELPTSPGLDTLGCMEQAADGRIRGAVCLGGNLYGSNPDAQFAAQAMQNLDLVVYLSTTLNTGHAHGIGKETYILPVLARDEEPESTTQESMFNFVRLSDGGPRRLDGPRSEVELIATLGEMIVGDRGPIQWSDMRHTTRIREVIAKVVPGYESVADIDKTKREFHIPGRILHTPQFPTEDGRAVIHVHDVPPLLGDEGELRLMTIRSEGQFNTVVYEEEDLYRGQDRRDVILIHPSDLQRMRIVPDSTVTVTSSAGAMTGVIARAYEDIRAGNCAMYYPEANVLVPRSVDPSSRTPSFKNILVRVSAEQLEATVKV